MTSIDPSIQARLDEAERLEAERDFDRAEKIYLEIFHLLPDKTDVQRRLFSLKSKMNEELGPASEEIDDSIANIQKLFRDLNLKDDILSSEERNLSQDFAGLLKSPPELFKRIGKDLAIVCGMSGDWQLALATVVALQNWHADDSTLKLWQLRALVELQRYAEAIGLLHSSRWQSSQILHVNYLAGLAFEALGMREQARIRFDAVQQNDPDYRDVRMKMLSY